MTACHPSPEPTPPLFGGSTRDVLSTRRIGAAFAASLNGPWVRIPYAIFNASTSPSDFDSSTVSNAAPAFQPSGNGSLLLAYKGLAEHDPHNPHKQCTDGSGVPCVGIVAADHWRGPYRRSGTRLAGPGEDPTLFHRGGGWHMIFEHYDGSHCGAHAYSADGVRWNVTPPATWYTLDVVLDGVSQKLVKRERPQVVWDGVGNGTGLIFNGACTAAGCFNINVDIEV